MGDADDTPWRHAIRCRRGSWKLEICSPLPRKLRVRGAQKSWCSSLACILSDTKCYCCSAQPVGCYLVSTDKATAVRCRPSMACVVPLQNVCKHWWVLLFVIKVATIPLFKLPFSVFSRFIDSLSSRTTSYEAACHTSSIPRTSHSTHSTSKPWLSKEVCSAWQ